ncbi:MAG: F0F1 ATP synthase subunit A [Alphaproteobacteria bacterium]|nr:F0F1 ATP synthase subunit A [Alphaproteobacteria bacterium]
MADPIHQFVITPIIPLEVAGINLSFTNSSLWMVVGALIASLFLLAGTDKRALIPGRLQAVSEMLYDFISSMIRENVGPNGRQYFPLIFTVFVIVLMGNVLGLLPYAFTYTSHLIVTLALAMVIFLSVTIFGLINHGLHFFSLFAPPGVPLALQILIVPIEVLSFIIRPITLSVRLFANMVAGHLMLKVFAGFSTMVLAMGTTGILAGLLPMAFNVAVYGLELLVALLQAYIFAILSAIYLKDTVDLHH